ncbi:MAG: hypothetical protein C5B50_14960 [Verrucomicrobia bacterium]|nr:MAG: hypothetical protein C5B50_14960 [Verrucomicrobiota bacterium]
MAQVDQWGVDHGDWVQIGDRIANGAIYWATNAPTTLYVEGIAPGQTSTKVSLDPDGRSGFISSDQVLVTVLELDVDVDNENYSGYAMNDDPAADITADKPGVPGKIIGLNSFDYDGDGIPGYADGFNAIPANPDFLTSYGDQFAPLTIELKGPIDLSKAKLRLSYDSSDPWLVTRDDSPPQWKPGPGSLRLWTTNAAVTRKMLAVYDGGNYVPGKIRGPSGNTVFDNAVYGNLAQLGFTAENPKVTFYLEGIAPSGSLGDKTINVELDPDGQEHWVAQEEIAVTILQVNIDIARADETPVTQDLKYINGSIVQLVPTNNPSGLYPNGIFLHR